MATNNPQYPFQTFDAYVPDKLIAGEVHLASRSYTLASGQKLGRGTVVGLITASGKLTICNQGATDGSQVPFGVLYDFYDATAGDLSNAGVYERGYFNENALILGTGWTTASIHAPLRTVGIHTAPSVIAV